MVDDLLARHSLRGQPRAAALALLGRPRPTDYFRAYDLVYWLGPERGLMSVDSEWLVIRLDTTGRVGEARLRRLAELRGRPVREIVRALPPVAANYEP